MITGLQVETKHDDTRVLRAIKENRNDQNQYLVYLNPNKNGLLAGGAEKGQAILISAGANNPNLISYDFRLKRGLYDVVIERIESIAGGEIHTDPESRYEYPDPVMVGQRYLVRSKVEDTVCYGEAGVRVRIQSVEVPLGPEMVYYVIDRDELKDIKYYVPFHDEKKIDFFVKGVQSGEMQLYLGNPSFQIERI